MLDAASNAKEQSNRMCPAGMDAMVAGGVVKIWPKFRDDGVRNKKCVDSRPVDLLVQGMAGRARQWWLDSSLEAGGGSEGRGAVVSYRNAYCMIHTLS